MRDPAFDRAETGERVEQISLLDADSLVDELSGHFDDPTLLSGPSAIASLGMRARAVAYTRPLHDLEANKGRLGGEAWARLNLVELGFHAIDVVALRMDFDSGARHDDVIAALSALAQQQDPGLEEPWRVGERVLEGLITGRGGSDADAHQATYGSWGPDGYVAKRFDYALLTEHLDEQGDFYLRVTDPAISVLMGALEVDVESAQIASELRLNELVRRGLLGAAIQEAQRAKYRSIQYTNQLQKQISQAEMQTAEPGTLQAVDELVAHALGHVLDRYRAERAIIANVTQARDDADDPVVRRRANQLIAELEQCEIRHQHLQKRLIRARTEFRLAHAEQLAAGPTPPSRVDIERQLIRPLLRAPLGAADRVTSLLFRLVTAPQPPPMVDLEQLIGSLCALPPTADELGGSVGLDVDDDLVDVPERRRFDDATWDAVDDLLNTIEEPTRLSDLLCQLRSEAFAADGPHLGQAVAAGTAADGAVFEPPADAGAVSGGRTGETVLRRLRPATLSPDRHERSGARAVDTGALGAAERAHATDGNADGAGPRGEVEVATVVGPAEVGDPHMVVDAGRTGDETRAGAIDAVRSEAVEAADARAHLLVLRAMHGFDPGLSEHVRAVERPGGPGGRSSSLATSGSDVRILWWRPTSEPFETETLSGDDLLVFPAWVGPDPTGLPPAPDEPATGDDRSAGAGSGRKGRRGRRADESGRAGR